MKLGYTQFYDGECVIIANGRQTNIKMLSEVLSIDKKLLIQILQKYNAVFNDPRSPSLDYYFNSIFSCKNFLESPQLEPYIIMYELCEENA